MVTSNNSQLQALGLHALAVKPLDPATAYDLIAQAATDTIAASPAAAKLITTAGGLPIHLLTASDAMAHAASRGRPLDQISDQLTGTTVGSFQLAYDLLDRPAQLTVHAMATMATDRVERQELEAVLATAFDWPPTRVEHALDTCTDRHLIEGVDQVRMHQLLAQYLDTSQPTHLTTAEAETLAAAVWDHLITAARTVGDTPGDRAGHARLLSHRTALDHWDNRPGFNPDQVSVIGNALKEIGRYDEARPWYERAVTEKQQGDIHGRIDHQSLGASLHQVGYCYLQTGHHDRARPWYERAVTEKQQGDIFGKVDEESLERSRSALRNLP